MTHFISAYLDLFRALPAPFWSVYLLGLYFFLGWIAWGMIMTAEYASPSGSSPYSIFCLCVMLMALGPFGLFIALMTTMDIEGAWHTIRTYGLHWGPFDPDDYKVDDDPNCYWYLLQTCMSPHGCHCTLTADGRRALPTPQRCSRSYDNMRCYLDAGHEGPHNLNPDSTRGQKWMQASPPPPLPSLPPPPPPAPQRPRPDF